MNLKKSLWWIPVPNESDGGAVVSFYQLKLMNYLEPNHQFHIVPKVVEELDAGQLPFAQFYPISPTGLGDIPRAIPDLMSAKQIPLLTLLHIPHEFFPIIDKVHDVGGKVLNWQTIHWSTDVLFQSDRLKEFDHWVTPTKFAKETLATVGHVDSGKMTVIPHGVNLEKFYPHKPTVLRRNMGIKDDETVILWLGRCQLNKGAHVIIPIIRRLLDEYPNVHFIARAGAFEGLTKSKEMGYMFDRMSRRDSRFWFIQDWKTPAYMEELMASADIGVCVSGHEGFSLPPLEWMACGIPVAISMIPNHVELMGYKNGYCGMFMEPTVNAEIVNRTPSNPDGTMVKVPKPDLIYGTLKWMIENPDECKAMGRHGLSRARKHYNLAEIADQWLNLFDELIEEDYDMDKTMQKRLLTK